MNHDKVMVRSNRIARQILPKLYEERDKTGDVIFMVDSEKIRAHQCVLSAFSPKYEAQFYGIHPEMEILVDDVTSGAFKEFLQFFYLEEVILKTENIEAVLNLAKQSLVDDFVGECIRFLVDSMTVENLCWCYRLAIVHDLKQLNDLCESKIDSKLFASDDFINCEHDLLMRILKLDLIYCKETVIFEACIAWARAACEQKNIVADNMRNLRTELGEGLGEVRFRSMSIEEFATLHRTYEGFFTGDESVEIMYMIGKVEGFISERFNQKPRKTKYKMPTKTSSVYSRSQRNIRLEG